jgi:hypothetical protein
MINAAALGVWMPTPGAAPAWGAPGVGRQLGGLT